jgi:hypothetical protein
MLVTLLMWAYAQGVTSSRRIEAACLADVAFRVICAGHAPDHVTIVWPDSCHLVDSFSGARLLPGVFRLSGGERGH